MSCQCAMKLNDWPPLPKSSTLGEWLEQARSRMADCSDSPALEVQTLAAHVLKKTRAWLLAHPEQIITVSELAVLDSLLGGLQAGQPLAYLTAEREFFGRNFIVRPGLLVPRPETELLVETALDWLRKNPTRRDAVDVGCGTGCIGVTLAAEVSDLRVDAIDVELLAVETTRENADRFKVIERVSSFTGNLLSSTRNMYNLICANLPYIPSGTLPKLAVTRFEPQLALDGGPDGLRLIDTLLEQSVDRLHMGGLILLEIEASQGRSAPELARRHFPSADIQLRTDLAGLPRLVSIQN